MQCVPYHHFSVSYFHPQTQVAVTKKQIQTILRFIIGTVIKQTLLHKKALLGKNTIMYSALFLVKSMGEMY